LGVAILAVGGVFVASNMGFKVNRTLEGSVTNPPGQGNSIVSLPYNRQVGLDQASDLFDDIDTTFGGSTVNSVARFISTSNGFQTYFGSQAANNFDLGAGQAYSIQVTDQVDYIIVGSHSPGTAVSFDGAGGSGVGTNYYSPPYHTTSPDAAGIFDEFDANGAGTQSIARFITSSNGFQTYFGSQIANNFALQPGHGLVVQINNAVSYAPAHF